MDLELDDDCSRRPSVVRPARPPLPQGPRVRSRPSTTLDSSTFELNSPSPSPSFTNPFLPNSPTHSSETSSLSNILAVAASTTSSHTTTVDVGIQISPSQSPAPASIPLPDPPRVDSPAIKYIPKPAMLAPPAQINFDSLPVPWKGLPFEAAQWTFTSSELQEIVSRAIRLSAHESFIRLLSIETLDQGIVAENERLSALKMSTQAQYRFQAHRRTMLLQALNSFVTAPSTDSKDKDGGIASLSRTITQLSEATATCDKLMGDLLGIADQLAQLSKLQDRHCSSALGIALRKLNKSYERQVAETRSAEENVKLLEDELEEAWREAELIAQEIDAIQFSDEDDEDIEDIEGNVDVEDDDDDVDENISIDLGEVLGVTATAVVQKATLLASKPIGDHLQIPDNKSVRSRRSNRSKHERRDSRHSRVAAAKTRSRATSNASLRLPKNLRHDPPTDGSKYRTPPPMPALPDDVQGVSFLDMDSKSDTYETARPARKCAQTPPKSPSHSADFDRSAIPAMWMEGREPHRKEATQRSRSMRIFSSLRRHQPQHSDPEFTTDTHTHKRFSFSLSSRHKQNTPPRVGTPNTS